MNDLPPELRPGNCLDPESLRPHLAGCGEGVRVFRGCRIIGAERVRIGHASQIDEGVFLFAGEGLDIGCHVHFAHGSAVLGGGTCRIGDFVGIGSGVRLVTGSEDVGGEGLTNPTVPPAFRSVRRGRLVIGDHAVIFTGSSILPGVTVGEGAVVAAGSIVHRDLKPWTIYAGTPLTVVGVRPRERILDWARRVLAGEVAP